MIENRFRPLQIIHSFEGFINGTDGEEVLITPGRKKKPDLTNFEARVVEGIDGLKARGVGGLVVNIGYDNYLEDKASWDRFLFGVRTAVDRGMKIWLYDENGYPSGTAGGRVLKGHPELEAIGIKRLVVESPEFPYTVTLPEKRARSVYAVFGVTEGGSVESIDAAEGSTIEGDYASLEICYIAPLFEGTHASRNISSARRYVNLLNADAVSRFLQLTHVKYHEMLPADLRENLEAIFTDEPSLMSHVLGPREGELIQEDPVDPNVPILPSIPWCGDMEVQFLRENGFALKPGIRHLFTGDGSEERSTRRAFWGTVSNIYARNFSQQSADVCAALGMDQTGHLLAEESIYLHALMHGDLIKALKPFQRPGVDAISCDPPPVKEHYFPAHKFTFSAAFFMDRAGLMTEVGDYCEWENELTDDHFRNIKMVLATQYLLGVRDFALYFRYSRFSESQYREITGLVTNLLECGDGARYKPDFALYYPIENVWELFIPSDKPFFPQGVESQSPELKMINNTVNATIHEFIDENRQFVMCGSDDIAALPSHGIKMLVYPAIGEPDESLKTLCANAGVNLIGMNDLSEILPDDLPAAGPGVILGRYDKFIFAVNYSADPSFITLKDRAETVYPSENLERTFAEGRVPLKAGEGIFVFP